MVSNWPVVRDWRIAAIIAAALFIAGWAAGSCGKPTSAELEAAHDSTQAAVDVARDAERDRFRIEAEARADSLRFAASIDSATAALRAARIARPATETRIVEREAPADTAAFRRGYRAGRDSTDVYEVRPLLAARIAQDSAYAVQGRLLSAERETRLRAQEGMEAALAEVTGLRDARPSWFARQLPKVGWAATGFVAGRYVVPVVVRAISGG